MPALIPIQTLDSVTVRAELQRALLLGDPVRAVSDFLLSVDWSTAGGPSRDDVAALLDEAEALTTAAEEDDTSLASFVAAIIQLASNETLSFGGGELPLAQEPSSVTLVIPSPEEPGRSRTFTVLAVGAA